MRVTEQDVSPKSSQDEEFIWGLVAKLEFTQTLLYRSVEGHIVFISAVFNNI